MGSHHLFVRHGESELNVQPDIIAGQSNHVTLTHRGRDQAAMLGNAIRHGALETPSVAFHSGAVRAKMTADLALAAAGSTVDPVEDPRLLEVDQGPNAGKRRDDVYTPEVIAYLEETGLDGALPGTESVSDAQKRMYEALMDQHETAPGDTVISFGHGFAIRCLVGKVLGLTKAEILELRTDNVSVSSISVVRGKPHVEYVGKSFIHE